MRALYVARDFKPDSLRVIRQAEAIAAEYAAQGYDLTLRQLYYQFVARGLIPNRQSEYKRLGSLVNDARLAGLLDWDYIVDRTRSLSDLAHWEDPAEIVAAVARQFRLAKWDTQPVRVEVWIEKEALAGVVERVCQRLDVPFFACRGYVSQSEQWAAGQRFYEAIAERDQDVVVLHLGDHDPSGLDMTRDNTDRLATFLRGDRIRHLVADYEATVGPFPDRDDDPDTYRELTDRLEAFVDRLTVRRIALNMDQVLEYDPPPNPAKLTDSRVGPYLAEHGDESWELDALPPDVLAQLIEDHVDELRDDDARAEVAADEDRHRELLGACSSRWDDVCQLLEDGAA
jgi:hypothetical protein